MDKLNLLISSFGRDRFKMDEPLANHTTVALGGPSKIFFVAFTTHELAKIVQMAEQLTVPYLVIGSGSKIVIADQGFDGLVVKNRTQHMNIVGIKGKVAQKSLGVDEALIEVDSGVSINRLWEFLNKQGLQTDEIKGLPGTVGGNLFLNKLLQSKVKTIKVLENGEIEQIAPEDLKLSKHLILSAVFRFKARI